MTKHHENKLTMYLGVKSVLEGNSEKTGTLPAFASPLAKFNTTVAAIDGKTRAFDMAATGKVAAKTDAEDDLIDELLPAISSLAAYAHEKRDSELLAKATVPESTLRRLRDTEVLSKANGLFELLQKNVGKLSDYGVTDAALGSLRGKIDAYAEALGKKEGGYSERSSLRKALIDLFDEADTILTKQMDPLMEQFRKRDVEFYDSYYSARSIKDIGMARKQKQGEAAASAMKVPGN